MANFDPKRGKGISKSPKLFQAELADYFGVSHSAMCAALKDDGAPRPVDSSPINLSKKAKKAGRFYYDLWEVEKWWKTRQIEREKS